jgi:hypothetical protein
MHFKSTPASQITPCPNPNRLLTVLPARTATPVHLTPIARPLTKKANFISKLTVGQTPKIKHGIPIKPAPPAQTLTVTSNRRVIRPAWQEGQSQKLEEEISAGKGEGLC